MVGILADLAARHATPTSRVSQHCPSTALRPPRRPGTPVVYVRADYPPRPDPPRIPLDNTTPTA
ncbi:hypothetical protein [Streptomyces chartreusis]